VQREEGFNRSLRKVVAMSRQAAKGRGAMNREAGRLRGDQGHECLRGDRAPCGKGV